MKKTNRDMLVIAHITAIRQLQNLHKKESKVRSKLREAQQKAGHRLRECLCGEDNNQHLSGCPMAIE